MFGAILALIPGISTLVNSFVSGYFNSKVQIYQSKTGAARDVAVAAIQAQEENNKTVVAELFGLVAFVYFAKCVIWDRMLDLGSTPDLGNGIIGWSYMAVIGGYFANTIIGRFLK